MSDGSRNPPADHLATEDEIGRLLSEAGMRQGPPADRAERVQRVVLDECRAVSRARRRRHRFAVGSAVLAAAALLLMAVGLRTPQEEAAPTPVVSPIATIDRVAGEVRRVAADRSVQTFAPATGDALRIDDSLETGAAGRVSVLAGANVSVRLDAASRIRFRSAADIVLERGTVYVDNQAASQHVSIHTALGVVRDIGTQYEVRLGANALRVRVRSGRIELNHEGNVVSADRGIQITLENGVVRRQTADVYGPEWAWTEPLATNLSIEGRRLDDVLARLCREHGWTLRYADDALARQASTIILTGTVEGLPPEEALQVVIAISGLESRLERGELLVRRP
jgi:ferric-dicitrate binding protein FerR (iron transport regulator)